MEKVISHDGTPFTPEMHAEWAKRGAELKRVDPEAYDLLKEVAREHTEMTNQLCGQNLLFGEVRALFSDED